MPSCRTLVVDEAMTERRRRFTLVPRRMLWGGEMSVAVSEAAAWPHGTPCACSHACWAERRRGSVATLDGMGRASRITAATSRHRRCARGPRPGVLSFAVWPRPPSCGASSPRTWLGGTIYSTVFVQTRGVRRTELTAHTTVFHDMFPSIIRSLHRSVTVRLQIGRCCHRAHGNR